MTLLQSAPANRSAPADDCTHAFYQTTGDYLQNLPTTSDDTERTLTHDYDQNRLYIPRAHLASPSASLIGAMDRLCKAISERIASLAPARRWAADPLDAHDREQLIERQSRAFRSWMTGANLAIRTGLLRIEFPDFELTGKPLEFCLRNGITRPVIETIALIRDSFVIDGKPFIRLVQDPEDGEEYLLIEIQVTGTVDDNLAAYRRYKERSFDVIGWPESRMIRLIYDIT
jgi:hypothetical protein